MKTMTFKKGQRAVSRKIGYLAIHYFEETQEWLRTHPQHTGGVDIDLEDIFQHASLDDLARDLDWCSKLQIKRICLDAARDMYEWARRTNNQEMLAWSEKYWEENR